MIVKAGFVGWVAYFVAAPSLALAAGADIELQDAWTTAGGKAGGEAPLYMAVTNHGDKPDSLQRVRCPVAWSTEQRVTDRGEGGAASRPVKSIAIPANATVKLAPGESYVALLQLKDPLREGDKFSCSLAFSTSGTKEVAVTVRAPKESEVEAK
ncbi:MAG: copper chaperone PCu(A)C [Acetobacteraceae bacterium]|nr:copper chaperone PCu(A)C [Acetobacteraceae bacterium]MBV8521432.1 copper chaperone PCu(A)C [Acetobacteraceae bacterium]MBV8590377.1 copper chaperone PCu(A)C [Acetobacteraceae bacterium]